jgi:tungstate transport system substrate-binding protein
MSFPKKTLLYSLVLCLSFASSPIFAADAVLHLRIATVPSIYNSGILPVLLSPFEEKNKVEVDIIGTKTEMALKMAEEGEVDALIINDPELEASFMEKGLGSDYKSFMYNYLLIVGPPSDPAGIKGEKARYAFFRISEKKAPFISRGDGSEMNRKEKRLWNSIEHKRMGGWYFETGKDMEETLFAASERKGYTLSDRLTYEVVKDMIGLAVLGEKEDPYLKNIYSVIAVNPQRYPHVKYGTAVMLIEYLRSKDAQGIINGFKVGGQQLFYAGNSS